MEFIGPVVCPNCQSPISTDHSVCPYCSSLAPATAPWQGWGNGLIIVAGLSACVLCDYYLGTHILSTLAQWLRSSE